MSLGRTPHTARSGWVLVWDPAVRLFHWSLVAGMAYELFAEAGTDSHELVGFGLLGLVGFRVLWGFLGGRHARFVDFVRGPRQVLGYLRDVLGGQPARHLGHNPAGGAMVVALLVMVAVTGTTGWAMTTDALWGQEWIEALHETAANLTLGLIILHVLGVIAASLQHRENLIRAMLTGRKPAE